MAPTMESADSFGSSHLKWSNAVERKIAYHHHGPRKIGAKQADKLMFEQVQAWIRGRYRDSGTFRQEARRSIDLFVADSAGMYPDHPEEDLDYESILDDLIEDEDYISGDDNRYRCADWGERAKQSISGLACKQCQLMGNGGNGVTWLLPQQKRCHECSAWVVDDRPGRFEGLLDVPDLYLYVRPHPSDESRYSEGTGGIDHDDDDDDDDGFEDHVDTFSEQYDGVAPYGIPFEFTAASQISGSQKKPEYFDQRKINGRSVRDLVIDTGMCDRRQMWHLARLFPHVRRFYRKHNSSGYRECPMDHNLYCIAQWAPTLVQLELHFDQTTANLRALASCVNLEHFSVSGVVSNGMSESSDTPFPSGGDSLTVVNNFKKLRFLKFVGCNRVMLYDSPRGSPLTLDLRQHRELMHIELIYDSGFSKHRAGFLDVEGIKQGFFCAEGEAEHTYGFTQAFIPPIASNTASSALVLKIGGTGRISQRLHRQLLEWQRMSRHLSTRCELKLTGEAAVPALGVSDERWAELRCELKRDFSVQRAKRKQNIAQAMEKATRWRQPETSTNNSANCTIENAVQDQVKSARQVAMQRATQQAAEQATQAQLRAAEEQRRRRKESERQVVEQQALWQERGCRKRLRGASSAGSNGDVHAAAVSRSAQPCHFFHSGYCRDGDSCPYSHGGSNTARCHFFARGHCRNGESCRFRHSLSSDEDSDGGGCRSRARKCCFRCGSPGHLIQDCPESSADDERD